MARRGGPNWKAINKAIRESPEIQEHSKKLAEELSDEVRAQIEAYGYEYQYFADNVEGIVIENPKKKPAVVIRLGGKNARAFEEKYNTITSVMTSKGFRQKGAK